MKTNFYFCFVMLVALAMTMVSCDNNEPEGDGAIYRTDLSTARIGDLITVYGKLIYVDDFIKLPADAKEEVVGVVFWTPAESERATPASLADDLIMSAEHPGCTHGLAVSLKNIRYNNELSVPWQDRVGAPFLGAVEDFRKSTNFSHPNKENFKPVGANDSSYYDDEEINEELNHILGYQNSVVIRAYNDYCRKVGKGEKIVTAVAAIDAFAKDNPAPVGSTGWFLPSFKELHILCYKDVDKVWGLGAYGEFGTETYEGPFTETRDRVNICLSVIGGEELDKKQYYYSSVELISDKKGYINTNAYCVGFFNAYGCSGHKLYGQYLRAVCAF